MSTRSTTQTRSVRHKCDIVRAQLNELHDTHGLSWRKIANIGQFKGIPPGTLISVAQGKRDMPDKYKARFGIPFSKPAQVCLIHNVVHQYDCQEQTVKEKVKRNKTTWNSLWDIPQNELYQMLINRKEV